MYPSPVTTSDLPQPCTWPRSVRGFGSTPAAPQQAQWRQLPCSLPDKRVGKGCCPSGRYAGNPRACPGLVKGAGGWTLSLRAHSGQSDPCGDFPALIGAVPRRCPRRGRSGAQSCRTGGEEWARPEPSQVDPSRTETSPPRGDPSPAEPDASAAEGGGAVRSPGGRARRVSVRARLGSGWAGPDGTGLGSAPQWRGGARPRARGGSARGAEAAAKMAARVSQGPAARGRS